MPDQTIAYMTENLNLTSALLARLDEIGGVSIFDNSKVEDIGYGPETETLDLSGWPVVEMAPGGSGSGDGTGQRRLAARLLVGADGANSPVRRFAGIESRGWDYDRHAVVATVQLEGAGWGGEARKTAYQRFLPTGPIALLPVRILSVLISFQPENCSSGFLSPCPTNITASSSFQKTLQRSCGPHSHRTPGS